MGVRSGFGSGLGAGCGGCAVLLLLPVLGVAALLALVVLGLLAVPDRPAEAPVSDPAAAAGHNGGAAGGGRGGGKEALAEPVAQGPVARGKGPRLSAAAFAAVRLGMSYDEVQRLIGPAQEESLAAGVNGHRAVVLTWQQGQGLASISFLNGRVAGKTAVGLR